MADNLTHFMRTKAVPELKPTKSWSYGLSYLKTTTFDFAFTTISAGLVAVI